MRLKKRKEVYTTRVSGGKEDGGEIYRARRREQVYALGKSIGNKTKERKAVYIGNMGLIALIGAN